MSVGMQTELKKSPPKGPSLRPQRLNVLAIEDNDDHFALMEIYLEEEEVDANLLRARSLTEAQILHRTQHFDIALLDLGLPESSGLATLELALQFLENTPVVVLTSTNDMALGLEVIGGGAADYVDKQSLAGSGLGRRLVFAHQRHEADRKLRRHNNMMNTLVAVLGHDLKSPPRQISILCDQIETALDPDTLAPINDHLDGIRSRCSHLRLLLRDTLAYAVNAAQDPKLSVTQLSQVMGRVLDDLDPALRDRVRLAADAPLTVDPSLMFHILRNLVGNGLKYWRETPSTVTVTGIAAGAETVVRIADTGIGIAPEMVGRVFDPVVRAVPKTEFAGTGFGLSIVRQLAEAHGGSASLVSELGKGTEVTIRLPFDKSMMS